MENLNSRVELLIEASPEIVWDALTDPEKIKMYFFGTNVETDWSEGSDIVWKGIWEGKEYQDIGKVLKVIENELLETTYWSSMSGTENIPENYKKIVYELIPISESTKLVITQDNNKTVEEKTHSENNWKMVMGAMKEMIEKNK